MIVVYSEQTSGFVPGHFYRNPKYFQAPLGEPEKVIVVGAFKHVAAAYRALGIEVEEVATSTTAGMKRPIQDIPKPPASVTERVAAVEPSEPHPLDHDGNGTPGGSLPADQRGDDVEALRSEYEALLGSAPDKRWGAPRLKREIEKAKG